jgi:Rrf2 family protein
MLRISTRGRYALRAMLDLALCASDDPVPRQEIAERQELSADYVAQLFRQLRSAGLVMGIKGPSGGYALAQGAEKIRVGDIIRAVEGPIAAVDCVHPLAEDQCHRADRCVAHLLWTRLSATMAEFLDSITLADLCDQARELVPEGQRADATTSHSNCPAGLGASLHADTVPMDLR